MNGKSCFIVKFTHPFADRDSFFGHRLGVGHIVLHNGLEQLILIFTIKWRL